MQLESSIISPGPASRHSAPFGLSICHNRPRPYLTIAEGGEYVAVRTLGWSGLQTKTAVRGLVQQFSAKSRRRALQTFAQIDRRSVESAPLFLTLTYPAAYPSNPVEAKAHLSAFWKRLRRKCPWVSAIWRIEPQSRGAPHFHLLVLGISFLHHRWVAANWTQVVGSGDPSHLAAGSQVKVSLSWRTAGLYVAKYLAKHDEAAPVVPLGRHWGILGRSDFPRRLVAYLLSEPQFFAIRAQLVDLVTGGHPETWVGSDYTGIWARLADFKPPASGAIRLDIVCKSGVR